MCPASLNAKSCFQLKDFTQVFFSYPEAAVRSCFFKICVLKHFAIFTGKRLFWSLFILRPEVCNFIKKILQRSCFPVNIGKFTRTAFL